MPNDVQRDMMIKAENMGLSDRDKDTAAKLRVHNVSTESTVADSAGGCRLQIADGRVGAGCWQTVAGWLSDVFVG